MSYRFVDSFRARPGWNSVPSWSCSKAVYKPVWHIPVPSVQWINSWWWAEELSKTCRVSCRSKFGKLVHQVGFITKKLVTMHGHMNVNFDTDLLCFRGCANRWQGGVCHLSRGPPAGWYNCKTALSLYLSQEVSGVMWLIFKLWCYFNCSG